MKLTCAQMDVLISFYIDGDLSSTLKAQVEEHIKNCATCRAKYDIIKSMLVELKNNLNLKNENTHIKKEDENYPYHTISHQYSFFRDNLSAYIDNELSDDDSLKIKKFTINNLKARNELETNYNLRKLMNDSLKKTKSENKYDYSKNILKQLELEEEATSGIHPVIKLILSFTVVVLVATSLVLMSLSV